MNHTFLRCSLGSRFPRVCLAQWLSTEAAGRSPVEVSGRDTRSIQPPSDAPCATESAKLAGHESEVLELEVDVITPTIG